MTCLVFTYYSCDVHCTCYCCCNMHITWQFAPTCMLSLHALYVTVTVTFMLLSCSATCSNMHSYMYMYIRVLILGFCVHALLYFLKVGSSRTRKCTVMLCRLYPYTHIHMHTCTSLIHTVKQPCYPSVYSL